MAGFWKKAAAVLAHPVIGTHAIAADMLRPDAPDPDRELGTKYERQGAVRAMDRALNMPLYKGSGRKPPKPSKPTQGLAPAPTGQREQEQEPEQDFLIKNMVGSPSDSYDAWRKRTYG
jgi:hypothetical protein